MSTTGKKQGIGYKRPPTATRFKKGQSGNPSGRPATFEALRDVVVEYLNSPTAQGKTRLWQQMDRMSKTVAGITVLWAYGFGKVPDKFDVDAGVQVHIEGLNGILDKVYGQIEKEKMLQAEAVREAFNAHDA